MKIPYTLVSMAAILRDHDDPNYLNDEHYNLTSIADYLYNSADGAFSDHPEDNLLPEFKVLFDKYGKAYFDKVLDDMYALDGQLTSDDKVQELIDDYNDRLSGITASTKVTATEDNSYNQHLVQVSKKDKQYVLNDLNKSHKTVGMGGAGDPGYYVSEFEPAYGLYLWASDTGLRILDDNGIEYTEVKKSVGASTKVTAATNYDTKLIAKWLKAKFDDEAFGTYKSHSLNSFYGNNPNDPDIYMNRNGLSYNRRNNTIELIGNTPEEDIPVYKVIPQYSSTKRQGTYAPKMPKLVPIDEWNAAHGVTASTKVSASDNPFYDKLSDYGKRIVDNQRKQFSPITFDVYNALLPYIGEYSSNTGWTGSCELMRVKDNNTADGYLYKVIWDDGHDVDVFSWQVNDNPRVGGDFTLMVLPAHGMPDFCDSEKDFYRAVRKVFGDGLKKIN